MHITDEKLKVFAVEGQDLNFLMEAKLNPDITFDVVSVSTCCGNTGVFDVQLIDTAAGSGNFDSVTQVLDDIAEVFGPDVDLEDIF